MATAAAAKPGGPSPAEEEFVLTRELDAPRELVWRAFTEPGHLIHWWGPKGFEVRECKVDLRPGGLFRYALRSPDGQDMWGRFVYREITPPERLVYIVSFTDERGNIARHPLSPTWPLQVLGTLTFAEQGGRTTVTIRWSAHEASEEERATFAAGRDSIRGGWTGTMDQLAAYLATVEG